MKGKKFAVALLSLALAAAGGGSIGVLTAHAGQSTVGVATEESLKGGIDGGTWVVSGKVQGKDDTMVFDDGCTDKAKVTAITKIVDVTEFGVENIFDASFTVNMESIPSVAGNRFAFAFGLSKVSAQLGSDGASEVYFTKDGEGLKVGVCRYWVSPADSGTHKIEYLKPTKFAGVALGIDLHVSVTLKASGKLVVSVLPDGADEDGRIVLCDESVTNNNDNTREGFIGFAQNGKCTATVSNVNISSYNYDNMATPLRVEENFDNGNYNAEAWYSKSDAGMYPGGISVADGALVFRNAQNAIFGTKYAYSNFEMTFDLVDLQREAETDDNGNVTAPIPSWFGISLATPAYNSSFGASVGSELMYALESGGRSVAYRYYPGTLSIQSWNNQFTDKFWDKSKAGEIYNMKCSMVDGVFTFTYKNAAEEDYPEAPFYTCDLGYTPTGYVRLVAYEPAGFTFDNFVIVNKDAKPTEVKIGYTANELPGREDFVYEDTWSDEDLIINRLDKETEVKQEGEGCNGTLLAVAPTVGALAVAGLTLAKRRRDEE